MIMSQFSVGKEIHCKWSFSSLGFFFFLQFLESSSYELYLLRYLFLIFLHYIFFHVCEFLKTYVLRAHHLFYLFMCLVLKYFIIFISCSSSHKVIWLTTAVLMVCNVWFCVFCLIETVNVERKISIISHFVYNLFKTSFHVILYLIDQKRKSQ